MHPKRNKSPFQIFNLPIIKKKNNLIKSPSNSNLTSNLSLKDSNELITFKLKKIKINKKTNRENRDEFYSYLVNKKKNKKKLICINSIGINNEKSDKQLNKSYSIKNKISEKSINCGNKSFLLLNNTKNELNTSQKQTMNYINNKGNKVSLKRNQHKLLSQPSERKSLIRSQSTTDSSRINKKSLKIKNIIQSNFTNKNKQFFQNIEEIHFYFVEAVQMKKKFYLDSIYQTKGYTKDNFNFQI